MAMPITLMQEDTISLLWHKSKMGVPVTTLIKQEDLNITSPTLTKLLSYVDLLEAQNVIDDEALYNTIYNSLFPEWLTKEEDKDIVKQPAGVVYEGMFPFGEWKDLKDGKSSE